MLAGNCFASHSLANLEKGLVRIKRYRTRVTAMSSPSSSVHRQWILYCTFGELVGFGGIPVLGGALALWLTASFSPDVRSLALYAVAIVAGFGEGAVLAWFQFRVLRQILPQVDGRRWMLATAVAASVAWMLGYLAPTLDDLFEISPAMQIAIWIPAGVLILLSIGTAQAWVLRNNVKRPQRWIVANALGWLLGLPWTFVLPAMVPENSVMAVWIATFVLAGILMGLTVGIVTGHVLVGFSKTTARRS